MQDKPNDRHRGKLIAFWATPAEEQGVDRLKARLGVSRAEVIRRAVRAAMQFLREEDAT